MNNQTPTTNSSDSDLLSLVPGNDLAVLTEALRFPDGYQMSVSVIQGDHDRRTYELGVIHATDEPDGIDFDAPIARGTADDVRTAVHTLLSTLKVRDRTYEDQDQQKEEATPWRSRYEGVERPRLKLTHTPGWVCEDCSVSSAEVVHKMFSTTFEPLGLKFDVFENDGSPISIGMDGEGDWSIEGAGELLAIADRADDLHRWLNDCATVTAWCHDHDTIEETMK